MLAGRFNVAGCPTDVSHGAVPRNRGRGDRRSRVGWSRAGPGDALAATAGTMTHLGGTSELMTQIHAASA